MKKRTIRIIVLSVSFIIALFVTGYFVNRGTAGVTVDMNSATLPTVSFTVNGQDVNLLAGHVKEMNLSAVRETIVPVDEKGEIEVNIQSYDQDISSMEYQILSLDGTGKLAEQTKDEVGNTVKISAGEFLEENKEALLKIRLELKVDKSVYYYTRLIKGADLHFSECMTYIDTLHANILEHKETGSIEKVLESNAEGDDSTLQHVTIHSDLTHVTWGKLEPELIGKVYWSVQEVKPAYTSVCLNYQVECTNEHDGKDRHNVKEFFRVQHSEGKNYLVTYDRTLEELFDGSKDTLTSKGISLGLAKSNMQYKTNSKGTFVSFVKANELWSYNREESEFALVFGFADSEKEDIRHRNRAHTVKILSMEENGNITFAVYGYMNRGSHEGESGAAIYYFNLGQNVVEEKAFIPSNTSYAMIEKELGRLAYYNNEDNVLYMAAGGQLCKVDLEKNQKTVLLGGLEENKYVSSDNGQLMGYQASDTEAVVVNFATGSEQTIQVEQGEIIRPLGFLRNDFVYGVAKESDIGLLSSGNSALGMYKLEIRNSKNQVVKTYQESDKYLLGIKVDGNMVTIDRAILQDGLYTEIEDDYITNNEEKNKSISLQSYQTSIKETQFRLVFEEALKDTKAKVLKPKQLLHDKDTTMEVDANTGNLKYSVFALGEMAGVYEEAGEAIRAAEANGGVVISPKQNYVWEDRNRVAWYRNFNIGSFQVNQGETALGACLRAVLQYENISADVMQELENKTALEVLEKYCGEAVQIKDGSSASMRYLIDKGISVIALTGQDSAIVLVGYDAQTITYLDPHSGGVITKTFSDVDAMMNGSGNTFLTYLK